MVQYNIKPFVWVLVSTSIIVFLLIHTFNPSSFFGEISSTVTILGFITMIYTKWLWKCRYVIKLLPFPYIGGEWNGTLKSTYNNTLPITINVNIHQGFFNTYVILRTTESESCSTCFHFNIDKNRGINNIIYTYQNEPNAMVRKHSEIHYGTAKLTINDKVNTLTGNYWTDRGTTGDIVLSKSKRTKSKNC